MPRVYHVKSARKAYPQFGIEKGDSYYWWKFRYRRRSMSKTRPGRAQLTQSPFLQELYSLQEFEFDSESLEESVDDLKGQLEKLREQCEGSLQNMPENLQDTSDSGILLQDRISGLEDWIANLESVDLEPPEDLDPDDIADWVDKTLSELQDFQEDIP